MFLLCLLQDSRSALCWAASSGSSEACEVLIKAGADMEAADKDGLTRTYLINMLFDNNALG